MKRGGGNPFRAQHKEGDKRKLTAEAVETPMPTDPRSCLPTPEMEPRKLADTAPHTSQTGGSSSSQQSNRRGKGIEKVPVMPQIIPTEDMVNIGKIMATMNQNVNTLTRTMEALQRQSAALTSVNECMKLEQEVRTVGGELRKQIERQKSEIDAKRRDLEVKITESLRDEIQAKLRSHVEEAVRRQVAERVTAELARRIPDKLKDQSRHHDARMHKISIELYNYEARRRNANVKTTEQLQPLRIPSARVITMSRSSSSGSAAYPTPQTALLRTPSGSDSLRHFPTAYIDDREGYVSPAFPGTLKELFGYVRNEPAKIRQLMEDLEPENALGLDLNDDSQMRSGLNKLLHMIGAQSSHQVAVLPPRPPPPAQRPTTDNGAPLSPLMLAKLK